MISIRLAGLKDCHGLAIVQVDSYCTAYAGLFPESYLDQFSYDAQTADWYDLLSGGTDDLVFVAVSPTEKILGYALARIHQDSYPGYNAELVALHVHKSVQGQHIGKHLFLRTVEKVSGAGCSALMLWTLSGNPIRTWYEKLGGSLLGEKSEEIDGWKVSEVAYGWKDLAALSLQLSNE